MGIFCIFLKSTTSYSTLNSNIDLPSYIWELIIAHLQQTQELHNKSLIMQSKWPAF